MEHAATPRCRPVLDRLAGYHPGPGAPRPPGRSRAEPAYKLSANEAPLGPLPSVLDVISDAARGINRYPDNDASALVEAIADHCGVPTEHVAVGCGSVGVTQMLLGAVAEPGAEVIYAWRSFEAYPLLVALSGAAAVEVPLLDEKHHLDRMAAAITDRTRLIFVCNPNNPTGTVVTQVEFDRFMDQVPEDCLVVLDEAYHEYVRDALALDGLASYPARPNLAVLRTFSKAYGLAGLRTGFVVAHPEVAEAVHKTYLPFSVNTIAQAAAIASLDAQVELNDRAQAVVTERQRVHEVLLNQGWCPARSEANFVWLRLGSRTAEFAAACDRAGVSVRAFPEEGARISIGTPQENDAFLAAARTCAELVLV